MKRNLANIIIIILFFCTACSSMVSGQTPGTVTNGEKPISNTLTLPLSTVTRSPVTQKSLMPTESEQSTLFPSQTSIANILPSQIPSTEFIINSGKEEIGTLFIGTDGSILKRLSLGLELSAVRGANYLYKIYSEADGMGIRIDRIDFLGNVEEKRVISLGQKYGSQFYFNYSISPDGKWITYMHGDNDYDPSLSENIDLWLLNVDRKEEIMPFLVTKKSKSANQPATWTAVGDIFTYADLDANGIVQLFEMDASTQKTIQITHFDESFRGQRIYQAVISPDNSKIAFTTITETGLGKVGVVDVGKKKIIWMQVPPDGFQPLANPLWWSRSGGQIMVLIAGIHANNANDSRIIWFDVISGSSVDSFPENRLSLHNIEHAFPLHDIDVVGFWGFDPYTADKQYWLYDSKSKILKKINLPDLGLTRFQLIQLKTNNPR